MTLIGSLQLTEPHSRNVKALNRTRCPANIRFSRSCKQRRAAMCTSVHLFITTRCFPADRNSNLNRPKAAVCRTTSPTISAKSSQRLLQRWRPLNRQNQLTCTNTKDTTHALTVRLTAHVTLFAWCDVESEPSHSLVHICWFVVWKPVHV